MRARRSRRRRVARLAGRAGGVRRGRVRPVLVDGARGPGPRDRTGDRPLPAQRDGPGQLPADRKRRRRRRRAPAGQDGRCVVTGRGVLYLLLAVVAGAAAMLSFAALRDLAELCGFAPVLAWLLPVVVDAGAAAGSLVWLRADTGQRARRFAPPPALRLLRLSGAPDPPRRRPSADP